MSLTLELAGLPCTLPRGLEHGACAMFYIEICRRRSPASGMACKRWCGSSMRIVSRARHEVKQPHSHEGQTSLEAEPRDLQTYMYMAAAPRPTSSL